MNTASTNVAARKRVKAMHGAAARPLALALACVLAVANVAAAPLGAASASADDSGKQRAGLTYQHVDLKYPWEAATGLVYDGTQKNGYVGRPEAILTVPGESDHSWQWPFYVEYSGINGTDYHQPKRYTVKDGINANAPVNAGDYRVIFSAPEDDAFADNPKLAFILNPNHIDFTIAKAPALTLSPLSAPTIDAAGYQREFDLASMLSLPTDLNGGPTYAVVDNTANGLAAASVDPATGKLTLASKGGASPSASDTVTVTLTDMGNYEDSTVEVNVSYTAKPDATISGVQAATSLVYNGYPQAGYTGAPQATYQAPENTSPDTYDGPFDISYAGTTADGTAYGPIDQAPSAAGVYHVKFAVPDSAPVVTTPITIDFTIGKASAPALANVAAQLIDAAGYQADLNLTGMLNLPIDLNGGPTYSVADNTTNGLASASIDPTTGKLTLSANGSAGGTTDSVTVKLSDMGNYEESVVVVDVSYVDKPDAAISGVQAATGLVYDGAPQAGYAGTPQATYTPHGAQDPATYDGPFTVTYVGTAADDSVYGPTDQAPSAAGDYRVTFAVPETAFFAGSLSLDFSIGKASLVFRADNASMTAGDAVPTLGYTVAGLKGTDHVTQAPRLAVEGDTASAGSCTIVISGGMVDNQASYDITRENAVLTIASPAPQIVNGADVRWVKGSQEGLTFISDADFSEFTGVAVDGEPLDSTNFDARTGSIVVTLKPTYLNTLVDGRHVIGVFSAGGTAEASFTIVPESAKPAALPAKPASLPSKPAALAPTGDTAQPGLLAFTAILAAFAVGILATRRIAHHRS